MRFGAHLLICLGLRIAWNHQFAFSSVDIMASALGQTINKLLDLCRAHPDVIGPTSQSSLHFGCFDFHQKVTCGFYFSRLVLSLVIGRLQGLPQKVLEEEIPDLEMLEQALNFLLSKVCCYCHLAIYILLLEFTAGVH